jgi:uncharacterized protein YigE (DUF2233 family)
MAAIRFSFPFVLLVLLEACGSEPEAAPDPARVVAGHCRQRSFEGSDFTVCAYDARRHRLALFSEGADGPLRSFDRLERHLGARARQVRFAMNAGMYDEEGRPIGLYVEEGRERRALNRRDGAGNFHLKPNGVFAMDAEGRVSVRTGDAWARARPQVRFASQSGPMLVIAGRLHPAFQPDGESRHLRNGVGIVDRNRAWFAISEQPVSFGKFARFFRDVLGCRDALFFDGTVSSLWDPGARRRDDGYAFGPMVAVFEREAPRRPARPKTER